jgi:hypothetical protein
VVGVAVGFCKDEVKPEGPLHDHEVASLELADRVTVPPTQIGPLLVAPVDDGIGLTVTVVVYTVVGEQPIPVLLNVNE